MKKQLLTAGIAVFRSILSIWYAICKCMPLSRKVVFLSRESDEPLLDFRLLEQELHRQDPSIRVVMRCHLMKKGLLPMIESFFYLLGDVRELAGARVAVCDTYSIPISLLHHRKELTVLQIWHALGAVKKFGRQIVGKGEGSSQFLADRMAMHKNYTYIYCTSPVTADFYAQAFGVPRSIIKVRGMPRVDYLRDDHPEMVRRFFSDYPRYGKKPIILYLPTFRKGGHPDVEHLLSALDLTKYDLMIRLHPLDRASIPDDYAVDTSYSTYDLMEVADLVISDYSAASIEASVLGKPVYFYVYDILQYRDARGLNINLFQEMSHSISTKAEELAQKIMSEPYDYEQLHAFCNRYVETKDQPNTAQIVSDIRSWVDGSTGGL